MILDRCTRTVTRDGGLAPIDGVREEILAANRHLSEQGLRVLAFAVRRLDGATTLRGILDALAEGAAAETVRVVVLLVDEDQLSGHADGECANTGQAQAFGVQPLAVQRPARRVGAGVERKRVAPAAAVRQPGDLDVGQRDLTDFEINKPS